MMVEEETLCGVERSNFLHVLSIKFEVEEIQILLHSFLVNGLRDDDYIALQQPAQGYLCSSLAIFLANLGEGRCCGIFTPLLNFIFFIIVKSYSCYFILLYSSSLTASCHSLDVFSPGISRRGGQYASLYLRSFAVLAWSLSRLRLEKADEVLGILKAEALADLRNG